MNIVYISLLLLQSVTVFAQIKYDYGAVLRNSILFYEVKVSIFAVHFVYLEKLIFLGRHNVPDTYLQTIVSHGVVTPS